MENAPDAFQLTDPSTIFLASTGIDRKCPGSVGAPRSGGLVGRGTIVACYWTFILVENAPGAFQFTDPSTISFATEPDIKCPGPVVARIPWCGGCGRSWREGPGSNWHVGVEHGAACSRARCVVVTLKNTILAGTNVRRELGSAAFLLSNGTDEAFHACQWRIEGDRVLLGASRHRRSGFARFVLRARPDSFAHVAATRDLWIAQLIRANLFSKGTIIVARNGFHLGASASVDWSSVLLKLATLEGFA